MPRVLIVKTSSLGDVIHQCPALSDAARARPELRFDWLVEASFADVPRLHRNVERVIPMDLRRWRARLWSPSTWGELGALRRALREQRYDVILDTQGLLKSALIGRFARGERHGYDRSSAREAIAARFYDHRHAVARGLHAVERNRRLTALALGYAVSGDAQYGLHAKTGDPLGASGPTAVLLTMSSRVEKLWPEAHWRALVVALARRGLRSVLPWGNGAERLRCEAIARDANAEIADAALAPIVPPQLSIAALAGCLQRARIVVGVDTGLTHLAVALETPAIGIYCSTDAALTGLHGARARNLGGPHAVPEVEAVVEAAQGWLA